MHSKESFPFEQIIHKASDGVFPVGFYLIRKIIQDKEKNKGVVLFAKSTFYQTNYYKVGSKEKPNAFILKENPKDDN